MVCLRRREASNSGTRRVAVARNARNRGRSACNRSRDARGDFG
jgi:hypothetical protein